MKAVQFALPILAVGAAAVFAQDRLPANPGYERYQKMSREAYGSVVGGASRIAWLEGGRAIAFERGGKTYKFDFRSRKTEPAPPVPLNAVSDQEIAMGPERGRQFAMVRSPDGLLTARSLDRNITLSTPKGEIKITNDGSQASRVKYGTASWVYGEELAQVDAMWWSPDSTKLAFYRFDESKVRDYYVTTHQLDFSDGVSSEAFPLAGNPNPVAELRVYDVASGATTNVDALAGNPEMGHYVYNVRWSPDGRRLLFFRMNRLQNKQDLISADPTTGQARVVFHNERQNGWIEPRTTGEWPSAKPDLWFIGSGQMFLFISDMSGHRNLDLYDLDAGLVRHLTNHAFDVRTISRIDPTTETVWYTTQGEDNPYHVQLHSIKLDGTGASLVTDPKFSHRVSVSPSGDGFVDIEQTLDLPPITIARDMKGHELATLATSDDASFKALGLKKVERFVCKAADGSTDIYGYLMKPSSFDASKRYPLLLSVYGGPNFGSDEEVFSIPDPITELGFLVAWVDARGSTARGVEFKQALYHHFGGPEIDDMAAAVRSLAQRPYVDGSRVGVYGISYGGYAALIAMERYPDVFKAGSGSSPVTDWHGYDSIYTERYMGLPSEQAEAYDRAAVLGKASRIKGRIQIYYGTADDNVHPSHTLMLIRELDQIHKGYDLSLGPDRGHDGVNEARMMEFFIDALGQPK